MNSVPLGPKKHFYQHFRVETVIYKVGVVTYELILQDALKGCINEILLGVEALTFFVN